MFDLHLPAPRAKVAKARKTRRQARAALRSALRAVSLLERVQS